MDDTNATLETRPVRHANMDVVQSTWLWWSNQVELRAQFGREGVLPDTAVVRAQQVRLPEVLVQLPGYQPITGSVAGKWENGQFAVDINAQAAPLKAETNLPPVSVNLHGRGDTNAAVIASAVISSPWLKAELSKEITLHFHGELLQEPASMKIAADLSKQPWAKLEGKVNGNAEFSPNGAKWPTARFTISGSDIASSGIQTKTLTLTGAFSWPWLELTNANAMLDDGSGVAIAGKMDVENKILDSATLHLNGPLAQRWLPSGYRYENLSLRANARGALTNLAHSGELVVTNFTSPQTRPLQLKANWSGEQMNLNHTEVSIAASNAILSTVFSMSTNHEPSLTNVAINLEKLSLQKAGKSVLELKKPSALVMAEKVQNYPFDQGLFSVGGGLRWKTIIGPIRVEYGYNLNPRPKDPSGTLLFSLGFPF